MNKKRVEYTSYSATQWYRGEEYVEYTKSIFREEGEHLKMRTLLIQYDVSNPVLM